MNEITRDDTEHGQFYYKSNDVDALIESHARLLRALQYAEVQIRAVGWNYKDEIISIAIEKAVQI